MYVKLSNIIPVNQARTQLNEIVNDVSETNYYVISRLGKPKAAVVDVTYLEKLQKAQAVQSLKNLMKSGQQSFRTFLRTKKVNPDKITEDQALRLLFNEFLQ